jgi:Ca2+/Na+ antiporter
MATPLLQVPGVSSGRVLGLILVVVLFLLVVYYMRSKKELHIRKVPGLDAIEEAVGRAAEMGKPVVASFGIDGFDYWTLAGLAILSHVAEASVKAGVRLIVPTGGSNDTLVVRPVAEEIVRNAYVVQGKPEEFNPDDVPFLSGQQYAYTGGYVGIIQRARPGAVIMSGYHASEAMNIAETSNAIGAITISSGAYISNTAALACASDYILIGEESPAAGAYLSKDPAQRASIRAQDIYKALAIGLMILGLIVFAAGSDFIVRLLLT